MGLSERGGYKHNPMYEMGYHRVGCIGCPLATYKQKMKEFADFPTYKRHYIDAFEKMLEEKRKMGWHNNNKWEDGQSLFDWWIQKDEHVVKGQMTLADYDTDEWGLIVRKPEKGGE